MDEHPWQTSTDSLGMELILGSEKEIPNIIKDQDYFWLGRISACFNLD